MVYYSRIGVSFLLISLISGLLVDAIMLADFLSGEGDFTGLVIYAI